MWASPQPRAGVERQRTKPWEVYRKITLQSSASQRGNQVPVTLEQHRLRLHRLVASNAPPTGDLACNPGMCPDWESNRRPFGLQAGAQSTEPHQPGFPCDLLNNMFFSLACLMVRIEYVVLITYKICVNQPWPVWIGALSHKFEGSWVQFLVRAHA